MHLTDLDVELDGGQLLDEVHAFATRFVVFPSGAAAVAFTLWAAHAHAVDRFSTTPRLAPLSPEPESGKSRALEILELLTPNPLLALNVSPAAVFRLVEAERPTLLLDEVDTIFTHHGKDDDHADLRGLLNAGYRKGATVPRCHGPLHEVRRFAVFAAVALAGLGDLPDTLMSRSIVIRMRRRAPDEPIDDFDYDIHSGEGHKFRERLAEWLASAELGYPAIPDGVRDRARECWRPLLAVAEAAGGEWPARARAACAELVKTGASRDASLGIKLLADLHEVFAVRDKDGNPTDKLAESLSTAVILDRLHKLDESPWADLRGKPLDARGLARRLKSYGITSANVRDRETVLKGYRAAQLADSWSRYLPGSRAGATSATPLQPQAGDLFSAADDEPVADASATPSPSATESGPLTSTVTHVADVADLREPGPALCDECGWPLGSQGCPHE
jgi:hypothetical protein